MKTLYTYMIDQLKSEEGSYDQYISYTPHFFRLLCDLIKEGLEGNDRRMVIAALAYFAIPDDFIPEDLYGPQGYADDLYVFISVLNRLKRSQGLKRLKKHWHCDDDLEQAMEEAFQESKKFLEGKNLLPEINKFVGL